MSDRDFVKAHFPAAILKRRRSKHGGHTRVVWNNNTWLGSGDDAAAAWLNAKQKVLITVSKMNNKSCFI